MISALDSRVLDANSEHLGVSVETLMENAGKALADAISKEFPKKKVLFICGTGNNGGDGFVASRIMSADCAMFSEPKTELSRKQFEKIENPLKYDKSILKNYDVIVDCILGTGMRGNVRQPYSDCIDAINDSGKIVVSCDIPSGLGADKAIKPDMTVTFHDTKNGMTAENSGKIVICDIGIPEKAESVIGPGDMLRYPIPRNDSHKGQNGRLLIVGGGPYIGAPGLAGMAALRVGADLVHIATPSASFSGISAMSPNFIMHRLDGEFLSEKSTDILLELSENADAVLIGPGLGTEETTKKAVREFVSRCEKPVVVDADGITAVSGTELNRKNATVFTPHRSEFKRLSGDAEIDDAADRLNAVIVLKGKEDVISDGKKQRKNITGTPAMTVGGTGDVLSGTISGLLSKSMSPFDSGCLGAYICGKAGEMAFDEFSYGLLATDVVDCIAKVLKKEIE